MLNTFLMQCRGKFCRYMKVIGYRIISVFLSKSFLDVSRINLKLGIRNARDIFTIELVSQSLVEEGNKWNIVNYPTFSPDTTSYTC